MNSEFLDEMTIGIKLLYQNQNEESFSWVVTNLHQINEEMQKAAEIISRKQQIPIHEEIEKVIKIVSHLVDIIKRENALELADCLKYEIYEYLILGAPL